MKVILRQLNNQLKIYIPKKDMETNVINKKPSDTFGGTLELENGMVIYIEPQEPPPSLPITLIAKRLT